MSVILSIGTISPPSGPAVDPPKSFQSDQLHPGIEVIVVVLNVVAVREFIDGVVDGFVVGVVEMSFILEVVWTEVVLVCGVVMPFENTSDVVFIVDGDVGLLLSVGELWTLGVVTSCVNLLVKEIEGVANVELVADMFVLVGEIRLDDVISGGGGMLAEKDGEGVPVKVAVDVSLDMLATVEEL